MSRREIAILLARLIVGLGSIHRENVASLDELIAQKKDLIQKILINKYKIESCLRQLGEAAQIHVDLFVRKHQRIKEILDRFESVRKVIVDAIEKESVSPSLGKVPAEFRIKCVASVKSIIFARDRPIAAMNLDLPQMLKRSLKQKGWNFLVTWLEALDDLERVVRQNFSEKSSKNERSIYENETIRLTAKASLEKLEEDCSAGMTTVVPA